MKITFEMKLPYSLSKGRKYFVASCPVLDVASQGADEDEARSNLSEALSLFILSCFERGVLEEVLRECGFRPFSSAFPSTSQVVTGDFLNVPVPFDWEEKQVVCRG